MSDLNMGTIYDYNKAAMLTEKPLKGLKLSNKITEIKKYFASHKIYFMLLCHERRDYTIFRINSFAGPENGARELELLLKERGDILAIDEAPGGYEIWVRIDDEAFAYYLFPYDSAVIEV